MLWGFIHSNVIPSAIMSLFRDLNANKNLFPQYLITSTAGDPQTKSAFAHLPIKMAKPKGITFSNAKTEGITFSNSSFGYLFYSIP